MHSAHPLHCTPRREGNRGSNLGEPRHSQNHNLAKARARSGVGLCFQTQPLATSTEKPGSQPPQTLAGQGGIPRLRAQPGWVGAGRPSPHPGPKLNKAPSAGLAGEDRQQRGADTPSGEPAAPATRYSVPVRLSRVPAAASRACGRSQQTKPAPPAGPPPPGKGVRGPSGKAGNSHRPERTLRRAGPRQ